MRDELAGGKTQEQRCRHNSMPEMAYAGEDHRKAVFVCGGDHFFITDGAAGLDDGSDSMARGFV
jgi:hypothetical protein